MFEWVLNTLLLTYFKHLRDTKKGDFKPSFQFTVIATNRISFSVDLCFSMFASSQIQ